MRHDYQTSKIARQEARRLRRVQRKADRGQPQSLRDIEFTLDVGCTQTKGPPAMRLEGWHLIIIIVLALVLFAAPKLPGMARSLGQSMRIFKSEVREMKKDGIHRRRSRLRGR